MTFSIGDDPDSFQLRYVGHRFNGGRLPVEVLFDLPAFRDLLVAFAKDSIRQRTSKKRVPNGFERGLSFSLVSIESGSALPKLRWDREAYQAELPKIAHQYQGLVHDSYAQMVSLFDHVEGLSIAQLGSEHVRALNILGAGLRDDERIEFVGSKSSDGSVVFLDSYRRKKLITKFRETYQTRVDTTGFLIGTGARGPDDGYIVVDTFEHGEITVPVELDRVTSEFDGNLFWDVHVDLILELDGNDKLRSIIDVNEVALVDEQVGKDLARCRERLHEVSQMKREDGGPVSSEAFRAVRDFLGRRPGLCAAFRLFPTDGHGILLEMETADWDISLEFHGARSIELYGISLTGQPDLLPKTFEGLSTEFLAFYDSLVGAP